METFKQKTITDIGSRRSVGGHRRSHQIRIATENYLELIENEKDETIDDRTRQFAQNYCAMKVNPTGQGEPFAICEPLKEYQRLGDGVYFYWYFLKFWLFVFGIVCVFGAFNVFLNVYGAGLGSSSSFNQLLATSLGNIRPMQFNSTVVEAYLSSVPLVYNQTIEHDISTQRAIFFLQLTLECVLCLIFFIAYFVFKNHIHTEQKETKVTNVTPNQFAIMAKFGDWPDVTEKEFADFFATFGKVCKVDFGRQFNGCLKFLRELGKAQYTLNRLRKAAMSDIEEDLLALERREEKLMQQIQINTEKINKQLDEKNTEITDLTVFKPVYGFVIFDDHKVAHHLLKVYEQEKPGFFDRLFCRPRPPSQLTLKGHALHLQRPDNPSNILWPNVEVTRRQRSIRHVLIILLLVIILILSIILNIIISAYGVSASINLNCTTTIQKADLAPGMNNQVNCYCSQLSVSQLLEESDLCNFYYVFQLTEIGKSVGVAVSVVIINTILYQIIAWLVGFIRYPTKAQETSTKILFATVLSYINTAFVAYIIYGVFDGFSVINALNNTLGENTLHVQSQFNDLDRVWYPLIGEKLLFAIIITVFNPTFVDLIYYWLGSVWRQWRATQARTRRQFLKRMKPPAFRLEAHYIKVLSPFMVVMTFAGGIPILYFLLFLNLLFSYWIDRVIVTRLSKRPALYSSKLVVRAVNFIPSALIIHMIFSIVILSAEAIFPYYTTFSFGLSDFRSFVVSRNFFTQVFIRAYKCLPLTLLLIFFFLVFVFESLIIRGFLVIRKAAIVKVNQVGFKLGTYTQEYTRIANYTIPNYNLALKPKYESILRLLFEKFRTADIRRENAEKIEASVVSLQMKSRMSLGPRSRASLAVRSNRPSALVIDEAPEVDKRTSKASLHDLNHDPEKDPVILN